MDKPQIQVDPNEQNKDGFVIARESNLDGEAEEGCVVTAYEPEDQIEWDALVIGKRDGFVLLHMNWDSVREYE